MVDELNTDVIVNFQFTSELIHIYQSQVIAMKNPYVLPDVCGTKLNY